MSVGGAVRLLSLLLVLAPLAPACGERSPDSGRMPRNVTTIDPAKTAPDGEALYATHCASCHGANRQGEPDWQAPLPDGGLRAPPHDGSGHTWHHPDWHLFRITKLGGQATAHEGFQSRMPAFETSLSDDEIRAVLSHIKSHWPEDKLRSQAFITKMQPRAAVPGRATDSLR